DVDDHLDGLAEVVVAERVGGQVVPDDVGPRLVPGRHRGRAYRIAGFLGHIAGVLRGAVELGVRVHLLGVAAGMALVAGRLVLRHGEGDGAAVQQRVGTHVPGHPDGVVPDDVVGLGLLVVRRGVAGGGGG